MALLLAEACHYPWKNATFIFQRHSSECEECIPSNVRLRLMRQVERLFGKLSYVM